MVAKSSKLSAGANYESAKLWSSQTFGPDNEASAPTPTIKLVDESEKGQRETSKPSENLNISNSEISLEESNNLQENLLLQEQCQNDTNILQIESLSKDLKAKTDNDMDLFNNITSHNSSQASTNEKISNSEGVVESVSDDSPVNLSMAKITNLDSVTLRQSKQIRKPSLEVIESRKNDSFISKLGGFFGRLCLFGFALTLLSVLGLTSSHSTYFSRSVNYFHSLHTHLDKTLNVMHPLALYSSHAEKNEVFNFKEIFKEDDFAQFTQVMSDKIQDHGKETLGFGS